jgi:hypothetical protein
MGLLPLRVQDVDFARNQIVVRWWGSGGCIQATKPGLQRTPDFASIQMFRKTYLTKTI